MTLADTLEAPAASTAGYTFYLSDGSTQLDTPELLERSERAAEYLAGIGVRRGDRVGILGPNLPEWVIWAFACWRAGAAVVPLPFHLFIRNQTAFADTIDALSRAGRCKVVFAHPNFLSAVPADLAVPWHVPEGNEGPRADPERPMIDDLAVLQFTSGSTASPKGAALTHHGILEACRIAGEACDITSADRYMGWLPFFHDWGMFGYIVRPMVLGCQAHILPTERFGRHPMAWFRILTESKATVTSGPSTAWDVAWQALARDTSGIDLSALRVCEHGAETIDPRVLDAAETVGGSAGLSPGAIAGSYGQAEITLGASVTPLGMRCPIDAVDIESLSRDRAVPGGEGPVKLIASCGVPLPDTEWRIADDGNAPLPERQIGELQVKSPGVMRGYEGADVQPFVDGWLKTGDIGYLSDEHFYFVARSREIVIAYGRNYAPDDFEWAAAQVAGVRKGRVVAFAGPDRDAHVIVALEAERQAEPDELARMVLRAVADAVGLAPHQVLVVPKGTITRTTSGKLQRSALRKAYVDGDLPEIVLASASGDADGLEGRVDP